MPTKSPRVTSTFRNFRPNTKDKQKLRRLSAKFVQSWDWMGKETKQQMVKRCFSPGNAQVWALIELGLHDGKKNPYDNS